MSLEGISPRLQNKLKDALGNDAPAGPVQLKVEAYLSGIKLTAVNEARAAIALSLARKLDWDYGNTAAAIAKELTSVLGKIDESTSDESDPFNSIVNASKMGNPAQSR